jgi:hypothetical protein
MRLHGNARTCVHSRLLIAQRVCEQGWTVAAAAEAAGVSERTAFKWPAIGPRGELVCATALRPRDGSRGGRPPSGCGRSSCCGGCG